MTDGSLHCDYQELPSLFANMDNHFAALGVTLQQTVAFACPNSVTGAVTLLYLLARGYSFMLLPPVLKGTETRPVLPHFCHHDLTVQPERPLATAVQSQPLPATRTLPTERLYLRTSGSLGSSKIVVHQHDRLLQNAQNCVRKYQLDSSDRLFLPVPIFHMYGMGAAFLSAVLAGAAIQIVDKANIFKIVTYEKQFQPTVTFLTPDLCEMMVRWKQKSNTYRVMVTSGQRIQDTLFEQCNEKFGNCLVNQYGSTEMGAIAACSWQDPLDLRRTTIGTPMAGVELRLDDVDLDAPPVSAGDPERQDAAQVGELLCRHPYGYLGHVDEKGDWIRQAESWYRTGDLARRTPSAQFQIVGRSQDSFNRRGYLVNLSEVAHALEQLAGVQSAVAFYLESIDQLVACCVASVDGAQIREASFTHLPAYARPDHVVVEESFPLLPSGKIDRQALQARLETRFAETPRRSGGTEMQR